MSELDFGERLEDGFNMLRDDDLIEDELVDGFGWPLDDNRAGDEIDWDECWEWGPEEI